jgi:nitroimidazol reductase NimA-like FMN-containing flavoprotein (pyridoxamine 5'-phosphate oxidase superfamily)
VATGRKSFHLRRKDKEVTEPEEIERIIREGRTCHLAMVDDGEPYVVPVTFGYDGRALYFHSALEGRKVEILKRNPRVCFSIVAAAQVVEQPPDCTTKYRSVAGYGRATLLTDAEEKIAGIKVLMRHSLGREVDFPVKGMARTLVFRIDIEELKGKQSV